jgi:hypothetical protein
MLGGREDGLAPMPKKSRWLQLKREKNLKNASGDAICCGTISGPSAPTFLKKLFSNFAITTPPPGPESSLMNGAVRSCGPAPNPMKKIARLLRQHRELSSTIPGRLQPIETVVDGPQLSRRGACREVHIQPCLWHIFGLSVAEFPNLGIPHKLDMNF